MLLDPVGAFLMGGAHFRGAGGLDVIDIRQDRTFDLSSPDRYQSSKADVAAGFAGRLLPQFDPMRPPLSSLLRYCWHAMH